MYRKYVVDGLVFYTKQEVRDFVSWQNVKLLLWVLFSFEILALSWGTPIQYLIVAFFMTWAIWRANKI